MHFVNAFKKSRRSTLVKMYQDLSDIKIVVQYKNSLNISLGKVEFYVQNGKKKKKKSTVSIEL